jgi:hypothetical protein
MAAIVLIRGDDGRMQGLGERSVREYATWRRMVEELSVGQTLEFSYRKPRSPGFHKLFFVMLNALYDAQERFDDIDDLRAWLTVGAGYCTFIPGTDGSLCALPKSIKWSAMDDVDFRALVVAVWRFLRGGRAQAFLWPHLTAGKVCEGVEQLLSGFEE